MLNIYIVNIVFFLTKLLHDNNDNCVNQRAVNLFLCKVDVLKKSFTHIHMNQCLGSTVINDGSE